MKKANSQDTTKKDLIGDDDLGSEFSRSKPEPSPTSLSLSNLERDELELCCSNSEQDQVVRDRAHALLLASQGVKVAVIRRRTGLNLASQRALIKNVKILGIKASLVATSRRGRPQKFPIQQIAQVLAEALASRPPQGFVKWNLRQLVEEVRNRVPVAATISSESIRGILLRKMGVPSTRKLEPFWLTQLKRQHADKLA